MQTISEEKGRELGRAQTEYYRRLEALPSEQRELQATTVAESVIVDVLRNNARQDVSRWTKRLSDLKAKPVDSMGKYEREQHQKSIDTAEAKLAEAQRRSAP